ncbi:VOC family protein [Paenibacillus xerothermodurans]|uniref:Glyoxalase n=1 Tax=Paenibacillus xerothermodurans TaxID=1977292 RepID=A0A2W1NBB3_PAEXE|nr:VOC family protein [Paenibacillus xerothermodurans]PZE21707.1 glyoxalase [Paenibacillus xerothermodurans]
MIEFQHLHHVSLAVRDLATARKFYEEVLQLQQIERPPLKSKGTWYAIGSQHLHLLENPNGEALRESGIDTIDGHFAIWVKSHSETVQYLEKSGVPYEARPNSVVGFTQIYILDPDNNIIEFDAPYDS